MSFECNNMCFCLYVCVSLRAELFGDLIEQLDDLREGNGGCRREIQGLLTR